MSTPNSTVTWRDAPLIPASYGDTAALVILARKARMQLVDFEWLFSQEDLRRLQRVVYDRGRSYTGRYRLFDCRMLLALRDALGDTDTILTLSEHKPVALEAEVRCERLDGVFRVSGHAPFVIVFGYHSSPPF